MLGRFLAPIVARFFERRPVLFLVFLLLGAGTMGWVSTLPDLAARQGGAALWLARAFCAAYAAAAVWYANRLRRGTAREFWQYLLASLARFRA